jgi:hypothetical protein
MQQGGVSTTTLLFGAGAAQSGSHVRGLDCLYDHGVHGSEATAGMVSTQCGHMAYEVGSST